MSSTITYPSVSDLILICIAIFVPPVSVWAKRGLSIDLVVNLGLFAVYWFTGWYFAVFHSWYIITIHSGNQLQQSSSTRLRNKHIPVADPSRYAGSDVES